MRKISSLVNLRKEYVNAGCGMFWKAYFRGTNNRVCQADGMMVMARTKQSDLKFDLLNNPMERGVINEY